MKTTHPTAVSLVAGLALLVAASPARADDTPKPCADVTGLACAPQMAGFSSAAPAPIIAAEACTLHASLAVDDKPWSVDVRVDGRRCATTPPANHVLPIDVGMTDEDSTSHVVVQAVAPNGVSADVVRGVVVALAQELRKRIEAVMAPQPPPAPPQFLQPQPPITTVSAPAPSDEGIGWSENPNLEKKAYSHSMIGLGVASMVVGSLITVGGFVGAAAATPFSGGVGTGLVSIFLGSVLAAGIGVPLFVVGNHKVVRVSASVAPTGGSLRVAF